LRLAISQELLSAVKDVTVRRLGKDQDLDVDNLRQYIEIWRECIRRYETSLPTMFQAALRQGSALADELTREVRSNVKEAEKADKFIALINQLRVKS
jgi:hypothetical protein